MERLLVAKVGRTIILVGFVDGNGDIRRVDSLNQIQSYARLELAESIKEGRGMTNENDENLEKSCVQ